MSTKNLLLVLFFCLSAEAFCQSTGAIHGIVRSKDGQVVPGVTVTLKGTMLATATNDKGEFRFIKVTSGNYAVQVSFIGFETQSQFVSVTTGRSQQINFDLKQTSTQLNEIVIVGKRSYMEASSGLATRLNVPVRDIPQSVQVINRELIKDRQFQSVSEAVKVMAGINAYSSAQYSDYTMRGFRASPGNFAYNGIRGDLFQFDQATLTYNIEKIEAIKVPRLYCSAREIRAELLTM